MMSESAWVVVISVLLLITAQPFVVAPSVASPPGSTASPIPEVPPPTLVPPHPARPIQGSPAVGLGPPRSALFPPRAGPVDPYAVYSGEPAPMGISDYGLSGNGTPYGYATAGLRGIANISTLGVLGASSPNNFVAFQLTGNVILAASGGPTYVFWAESIAELNTSSGFIVFFDALWNETVSGASIVGGSVVGNGTVDTSLSQQDEYTDTAGPGYTGSFTSFPEPGLLGLELLASNSSAGVPQITFGFRVGGNAWMPYDTLTFRLPGTLRSEGFVVNGSAYTPATTFYDAEFVLGGAGARGSTGLVSSQMTFALRYWAGHNYRPVPEAWNFGSDASGTVTNAVSSDLIDPSTGFVGARIGTGPGLLGPLYNSTAVGSVVVIQGLANGTVEVDGSSEGPFVGSPLLLLAPPGPLNVTLSVNGFPFGSGTVLVRAGGTVTLLLATRPLAVIEFRSVGLPVGTPWSVTVRAITDGTTASNLSFPVPAGPYVYAVNPPAAYRATPGGGSVMAVPPEVNVTLQWTGTLFPVFFNETGLPLPTNWTVTLSYLGQTIHASTNETGVVGTAPPGNFTFVVSTRAPYAPMPARGTGTIYDRPQAFEVQFTLENGTVEGVVVPRTASVEIGGVAVPLTLVGGYRVVLPPGNYPANFSAPGYSPVIEVIPVAANQTYVNNVTLLRPVPPTLFTGDLVDLGIAAIAVVLFLVAIVVWTRRRSRPPEPPAEPEREPFYTPSEPAPSDDPEREASTAPDQ